MLIGLKILRAPNKHFGIRLTRFKPITDIKMSRTKRLLNSM